MNKILGLRGPKGPVFLYSLDEAIAQLREEPSGVLGLNGPDGQQVGALISPRVLQEIRHVIASQHLAAVEKKKPTRKERKLKAQQRERQEEARPRSRSGRLKYPSLAVPPRWLEPPVINRQPAGGTTTWSVPS